jgi:hypothetical protein
MNMFLRNGELDLYRWRFKMGHPVGVSFQIITDTAPSEN